MTPLSDADIAVIVKAIMSEFLVQHYQLLGYDIKDPDDIKRLQTNHIYLEKARVGNEEVYKWVRRSAIGVAVVGLLGILFKALFPALQ